MFASAACARTCAEKVSHSLDLNVPIFWRAFRYLSRTRPGPLREVTGLRGPAGRSRCRPRYLSRGAPGGHLADAWPAPFGGPGPASVGC